MQQRLRGLGVGALALVALTLVGGCRPPERQTGLPPGASAMIQVPPGGPDFSVQTPEGLGWAQANARDLLQRCYRTLREVYYVDPPVVWQVTYGPTAEPAYHDLLAAPVYEGEGRLQLSAGYLAAPSDDPGWRFTPLLGTVEGVAYGFNDYFGLQNTDVDLGLAAVIARQVAPIVWGGVGLGEIHAQVLKYQEAEDKAVTAWRETGARPEGGDERSFERMRQMSLCRKLAEAGSPGMWRMLFQVMGEQGRPLTQVADRKAGNRRLVELLKEITWQDFAPLFKQYGYEL